MDLANMEVSIFKALGHPLRLGILKQLDDKELCVCELTDDEHFSQSNISQHLKILKDADLVMQRKEGLKVYYKVKDMRTLEMIKVADGMIVDHINELKSAIG